MNGKYDWNTIREEYARGTSVRKICQKYGMSITTVGRRSKKENWEKLRTEHMIECANKTMAKNAKKRTKDQAELQDTARRILQQIERSIDDMDAKELRSAAAALKDLEDVLGIRHELDVQEQKARIANLQRTAETENKNITVVISAEAEDYAV